MYWNVAHCADSWKTAVLLRVIALLKTYHVIFQSQICTKVTQFSFFCTVQCHLSAIPSQLRLPFAWVRWTWYKMLNLDWINTTFSLLRSTMHEVSKPWYTLLFISSLTAPSHNVQISAWPAVWYITYFLDSSSVSAKVTNHGNHYCVPPFFSHFEFCKGSDKELKSV